MVTHMEFFSSLRRSQRTILLSFLLCLATLNVTACDYISKAFYPEFRHNEDKIEVEKPPFLRSENLKLDDDSITVNPLEISDGTTKEIKLKDQNIFATPVKNEEERFARIENKVQQLSDMLNKMSPAITRLIDVESELDILTFQLEEIITKGHINNSTPLQPAPLEENLLETTPTAIVTNTRKSEVLSPTLPSPTQSETIEPMVVDTKQSLIPPPVNIPPPKRKAATNKITLTPITPTINHAAMRKAPTEMVENNTDFDNQTLNLPAPITYSTSDTIQKIRLGDHPNKTRIVFETEQATPYSVSAIENNKTIIINFPDSEYQGKLSSRARLSDRVKTITQNQTANGSSLVFELVKAPRNIKDFRMTPDRDVSDQRIVIDLMY